MADLRCFFLEESVRVTDGETRMNQNKSRIEATSLIFWLQEWGGLWAMGWGGGRGEGRKVLGDGVGQSRWIRQSDPLN